jgi:hypothetical protein
MISELLWKKKAFKRRCVGLFLRDGALFLQPYYRTTAGVLIGGEPVERLELPSTDQELGQALRTALDHTRQKVPHPTDWDKLPNPLYEAAGVKSWPSFIKRTRSCEVTDDGRILRITPMRNAGSRDGFQFLEDLSIELRSDASTMEIGRSIRMAMDRALDFAKAAESNPPPRKKVTSTLEEGSPQSLEPGGHIATPSSRPALTAHESLLRDIEELGFFRYTNPKQLDQEKAAILELGWAGIFGDNGRWFFADAEELTEGGVSALITEITPFLEDQGVKIPPLEDEFDPDQQYILIAGEERFPIWTEDESEKESKLPGLLWGASSTRTIQMLNRWLARAGSTERAYGVNAGNDFAVFFLTPELYERIRNEPEASAHDGPYEPNLEYPSFGQPPPY